MSKSKNYNSIVFLTTLSVYLGLVLSGGATPSVLAHSALTRDFDLKNEIIFEEDLDKKPDDEISENVEIIRKINIVEAISNFVSDLKKLESIGKFNPKEERIFSYQHWTKHYSETYSTSINREVSNPWLETALSELISTATPDYLHTISDRLPNCDGTDCREYSVEIEATKDEFSINFTFTKSTAEKAKLAAEAFGKVFLEQKDASKNTINLPIYENTKAISENNQVFIVTRLPRASIDSLIAQKDAR
jgi:hypothetical protein